MKKFLVLPLIYLSLLLAERFEPTPYNALDQELQTMIDSNYYEEQIRSYQHDMRIDWQIIKYQSDEFIIKGFVIKPKHIDSTKKYPVLFFNHGGLGEMGKITVLEYQMLRKFIDRGYVIFATQYRGCDGSQGNDELGGRDVYDVIHLIELAKKQQYVDTNNMFMFGHSRGGMMSYLALKAGVSVNAVATSGGVTDLWQFYLDRIQTYGKNAAEKLRKQIQEYVPGFNNDEIAQNICKERSAVNWTDCINTPLLLLHGKHDKISLSSQSELLAQKLAEYKKIHTLVLFDGGHEVSSEHVDIICDWFEQYKK